jgi:transposase
MAEAASPRRPACDDRVDDATAAAIPYHQTRDGLQDEKDALHIDLEQTFEALRRNVEEWCHVENRRVVDEDVDPAGALGRFEDGCPRSCRSHQHPAARKMIVAREPRGPQHFGRRKTPRSGGHPAVPLERSFAWLGRNRRLSKDYEYSVQTSETLIDLAAIRLILNRLASA